MSFKLYDRLNSVDLLTAEDEIEKLYFELRQLKDKLICLQNTFKFVSCGSQDELYYRTFIKQVKYSIGEKKVQLHELCNKDADRMG